MFHMVVTFKPRFIVLSREIRIQKKKVKKQSNALILNVKKNLICSL